MYINIDDTTFNQPGSHAKSTTVSRELKLFSSILLSRFFLVYTDKESKNDIKYENIRVNYSQYQNVSIADIFYKFIQETTKDPD